MFLLEMEDADEKFGQKRKRKHMFNEEGVPIEPFNIRDDVAQGIITQEGALKRQRREEDPWLQSIQDQQEQMLRKDQEKQQDSDLSEESDEGKPDVPDDVSDGEQQKTNALEVLKYKEQLHEILQKGESAY